MEPEREPRRASDAAVEVVTEGDVPMGNGEARSERNCSEAARETGIARALIGSERKP